MFLTSKSSHLFWFRFSLCGRFCQTAGSAFRLFVDLRDLQALGWVDYGRLESTGDPSRSFWPSGSRMCCKQKNPAIHSCKRNVAFCSATKVGSHRTIMNNLAASPETPDLFAGFVQQRAHHHAKVGCIVGPESDSVRSTNRQPIKMQANATNQLAGKSV